MSLSTSAGPITQYGKHRTKPSCCYKNPPRSTDCSPVHRTFSRRTSSSSSLPSSSLPHSSPPTSSLSSLIPRGRAKCYPCEPSGAGASASLATSATTSPQTRPWPISTSTSSPPWATNPPLWWHAGVFIIVVRYPGSVPHEGLGEVGKGAVAVCHGSRTFHDARREKRERNGPIFIFSCCEIIPSSKGKGRDAPIRARTNCHSRR